MLPQTAEISRVNRTRPYPSLLFCASLSLSSIPFLLSPSFSPIPLLSLPPSPLPFPVPCTPLRGPSPIHLGFVERCELLSGSGWSPTDKRFLVHSELSPPLITLVTLICTNSLRHADSAPSNPLLLPYPSLPHYTSTTAVQRLLTYGTT